MLNYKAIPWMRQQPFRTTSVEQILRNFDSFNAAYVHPPRSFAGINGFADSIESTLFCWRWFKYNDSDLRIVTIEDANVKFPITAKYRPRDLKGIDGYQDGLENAYFCWRWENRNGSSYRVVTIEDGDDTHEGSGTLRRVTIELIPRSYYKVGIESPL
jgi:hypothetical protein